MRLKLSGFAAQLAVETENLLGLYASMLTVEAAYTATTHSYDVAAHFIAGAKEAIAKTWAPNQRKLNGILDAIGDVDLLTKRLMAMGQRIHGHERYIVAIDVFDAVYDLAMDDETKLSALYWRAFSLRMLAKFNEAGAAYATLELHAAKVGNDHMLLEARLGQAKIVIEKGNLPAAISMVDRAIMCASYMHVDAMQGKALLARQAIAGMSRDPRGVIRYGLRAAPFLRDAVERVKCRLNIAIAYRELGRHDKAIRLARVVRGRATLSDDRGMAVALLYHLATDVGDDVQQAECHAELGRSTSPLVVIERYECVGRAFAARGDFPESRAAYETMLDLAQRDRYGEAAYRAEEALRCVAQRRVPPAYDYNPPRLMAVGRVNALAAWQDVPRTAIVSDLRRAGV